MQGLVATGAEEMKDDQRLLWSLTNLENGNWKVSFWDQKYKEWATVGYRGEAMLVQYCQWHTADPDSLLAIGIAFWLNPEEARALVKYIIQVLKVRR